MVPSFQLLLERLFGLLDTKALFCAVELRVPDLLGEGSKSADELAAEAGADPDAVLRLLRYLVSRGIFSCDREKRFSNNAVSDILRSEHPFSARGWVDFFGSDWNAEIWNHLPERMRGTKSAAEAAFGTPFFEFVNQAKPEDGAAFNDAMVIGSRIQATLFGKKIDLDRVTSLCDVGGGTGAVVAHLLQLHPDMQATLLDLPHLQEPANRLLAGAGVADRCRFVGGDFFEAIPGGHEVYALFAVVHDWDDDRVVRILENIRSSMPPKARVMVIEKPLSTDDREDFAKASDLLMLALSEGGRERTDAQYESLFRTAGFSLARRTTLPSLFCVYELRPVPD